MTDKGHFEDRFFRDELEWFVETIENKDIPVGLVISDKHIGFVRFDIVKSFKSAMPAWIRIDVEHSPEAGKEMNQSPVLVERCCENADYGSHRAEKSAGGEEIGSP